MGLTDPDEGSAEIIERLAQGEPARPRRGDAAAPLGEITRRQ
ncbi:MULTISPECIES: hypothetical protein [Hyphomicrobiales]|nr:MULTISPECIES: hypothetical protein [Hyphomicrobiales]